MEYHLQSYETDVPHITEADWQDVPTEQICMFWDVHPCACKYR